MSEKNLTWAFSMKPLKNKCAKVFASKDQVQEETMNRLVAMLKAPGFQSGAPG